MKYRLTVFLFLCVLTVNAQWDKGFQDGIKRQIFQLGKTLGLNDIEAKKFSTCCLSSMMKAAPKPQILTMEQLKELGKNATAECLDVSKINMKWSAQSENLIRKYFKNDKELDFLKEDDRVRFEDCVLKKMKVKFPNGIVKMPDDVAKEIGEACVKEVSENLTVN